ncbi:MAG: fdxN element excision recombinase XisF [Actinomycetota bacterium]
MPEPSPIVGYARVSTREQALNSQALEQQQARLKQAGAMEILTDVESGRKDDRSQLQKLIKLIKAQNVNVIIATRIDRIARSTGKFAEIAQLCLEYGVNLRILDQDINLDTSQGKFMANLLASLAELETDQISERVRHGNNYRRQQKKACSSYPLGYQVKEDRYVLDERPYLCLLDERPDNYLEFDSDELEISQLPGLTVKQIARDSIEIFFEQKGLSRALRTLYAKYGIAKSQVKKNGHDSIINWTPSSFRKWLLNPVLQGHTAYQKKISVGKGKTKETTPSQWQIIENTHPQHRLITESEAAEIQKIIEFNLGINYQNFNANPALLDAYGDYTYQSGLVFCGACHCKCTSKSHKSKDGLTKYQYYGCRHSGKGCNNTQNTRKSLIEQELIKKLLEAATTIQAQPETPVPQKEPEPIPRLRSLQDKLEALEKISPFDPDIEAIKDKTRQEIEKLLNPFATQSFEGQTVAEIIQAGNNLAIWHTLSNDEKVKIFPLLVERITVRHGAVESIELKP